MDKRLIVFTLALVLSATAYAQWDDCPFGLVNDTAPGSCGRFVDTDGDGICDHSQPAPEDRVEASTTTITSQQQPASTLSTASADPDGGIQIRQRLSGRYNLILITIALTALYIMSWVLVKKGKLSLVSHRRLWNLLLLVSFVFCAITGFLIALRLDLDITIPEYALMSFWHIETGIAMILVGVFHCLWHWKYYMTIIRRGRKSREEVCITEPAARDR